MPEQKPIPGKPKGVLGDIVKAESFLQLAFAMPIGCVVGWLLGHWADGKLGTSWIGIVGILIGAAGGFLQIFTIASRYMKKGE